MAPGPPGYLGVVGAAADCELITEGLLGQPVNTVTTAAFLLAGLVVASRPWVRWVGIALIATGLGSFLFHGPMPPVAEWAHDVSLAWLILVVAGLGTAWERWALLPGLAGLGLLFALAPPLADPIAVGLTVFAVVSLIRRDRSAATLAPVALLAALAIVGRLGASGGPWCDPASIWQLHGLWHVGSALAVAWWAMGYSAQRWRVI